MSPNFSLNTDIANKKYQNKIDIYQDSIKEILKIKKNLNTSKKPAVNDKNSKDLNSFEDTKELMDLENSYQNSLILLDMMQKKIEENIFKKYNNEEIQNTLIKKNS